MTRVHPEPRVTRLLYGTCILLAAVWFGAVASVEERGVQVRNAHGGIWEGVISDDVIAFYGIRYATHVRFQAPQKWIQVNHTVNSEWGPLCAQFHGRGSEDCLFLSVFVPMEASSKLLPVAVHIHGGSFARGSAKDSQFPHMSFAKSGVVTVTLAYRVGLLGFMSMPQFLEENPDAPANFGLLDQRMALEWVRDNIALFGGDPNEVTVFGESAGAASILHQMTWKNGTEPSLFKRAFVLSSPALSGPEYALHRSWIGYSPVAESWGCGPNSTGDGQVVQATEQVDGTISTSNTSTSSKSILDCMRAVDYSKLELPRSRLMVFPYVTSTPAYYLRSGWPVNDHINFPDVGEALATGQFNKDVEVIIGSDLDEGSMFVPLMVPIMSPSLSVLHEQLRLVYGETNAERIWSVYKPVDGADPRRVTAGDSFAALSGDTILNCITWTHARSLAQHSHRPVHRYANEWVYTHAALNSFGAFHTSSLAFFYNNIAAGKPFPNGFSLEEQTAANILFARTLNFVKGGGVGEDWPSFDSEHGSLLLLTANTSTGNLSISITKGWKNNDCEIWPQLYPPYGLWAPPSFADIWALETFPAAHLNSAMWWVFLNLKIAAIVLGCLIVAIFVWVIRCCCKCCCPARRRNQPMVKEKID